MCDSGGDVSKATRGGLGAGAGAATAEPGGWKRACSCTGEMSSSFDYMTPRVVVFTTTQTCSVCVRLPTDIRRFVFLVVLLYRMP